MSIRRRRKHHAAVESGALSDILFFLLIFFLMVASMSAANMMKLNLPKSTSVLKAKKEIIHLYLSVDGKYFIEKEQVGDIESALMSRKKDNEEQTVMIGIEKDRTVQELVTMVEVVKKVGMKPVLATAKQQE
jgi:biopolymer transport protein ExbD